jgi:ABC-type uncharacterized transport system ATPase subunit
LIDKGQLLFDGSQASFHDKYRGLEFMIDVEFTQATDAIDHVCFRVDHAEGKSHSYWIPYAQMGKGEAITYIATHYSVADITVRELGLENILKNIYGMNTAI